jgi:hypothetical protein
LINADHLERQSAIPMQEDKEQASGSRFHSSFSKTSITWMASGIYSIRTLYITFEHRCGQPINRAPNVQGATHVLESQSHPAGIARLQVATVLSSAELFK